MKFYYETFIAGDKGEAKAAIDETKESMTKALASKKAKAAIKKYPKGYMAASSMLEQAISFMDINDKPVALPSIEKDNLAVP